MSELLSSITGGGGGGFTTKTIGVYSSVGAGASGQLILLTPPSGQKVMLTTLSVSGSIQEPLITVNVGGVPVISGGTLDDADLSAGIGSFSVGPRAGGQGDQPVLIGGFNEAIEVVKDSGNTVATVFYSYRFGV